MTRNKLIKSEVVQLFNTTIETLRHYEEKGILKPEIGDNNYRYYDFEDLQKLRQIFLFRDLELSIEEMKKLDEGQVKKSDYIEMLKIHQSTLQKKIQRLQNIEENIKQLLELLEKGDNQRSYRLRLEKERHYYLLDPFEEEAMSSPKAYFDRYRSLIQSDNYSERTLEMIYPYKSLQSGQFTKAQLCIELPIGDRKLSSATNEDDILILPEGTYLSIFYPFQHGRFEALSALKDEIEDYLKENDFRRRDSIVLEREHPELSLFLDETISIFELQIQVEKE